MVPAGFGRVPSFITVMLAISAAVATGYWSAQAIGEADTEALESPLMLSVARQLTDGPGGLYGPFGRANPLVLIHAPIYYRLSALAAWPMARAGLSPVVSARIAGRSLSFLGLLATLAVAYRLARLGGKSKLAGWWALLIVAGSPILAAQPFAVRPDMLGIALQSAGLLLVLSAMSDGQAAGSRVVWGYVAFGLALCVKQHLVVEAAVCTALLVLYRGRGAVPFKWVLRGLAAGVAVVAVVYGAEWGITFGQIWDAAFVAAGGVRRVHPGGIGNAQLIMYGLVRRNNALFVLAAGIGLTMVGFSRGIVRKCFVIAGAAMIVRVIFLSIIDISQNQIDLEIKLFFSSVAGAVVFLVCAAIERSALLGNRLDAILWLCVAAEFALTYFLCYLSTGAWLNYAIQAVVLVAVLLARAAARVTEATPSNRALWPMALCMPVVLISIYNHTSDAELERKNERVLLAEILDLKKQPGSAFFFFDRPGLNRINGRQELVYDHWLYPVFESMHLAESRSAMLAEAFQSRSLRNVVRTSQDPDIEGTGLNLRAFGFRPGISIGPYFVWSR